MESGMRILTIIKVYKAGTLLFVETLS